MSDGNLNKTRNLIGELATLRDITSHNVPELCTQVQQLINIAKNGKLTNGNRYNIARFYDGCAMINFWGRKIDLKDPLHKFLTGDIGKILSYMTQELVLYKSDFDWFEFQCADDAIDTFIRDVDALGTAIDPAYDMHLSRIEVAKEPKTVKSAGNRR